MLGAISNDTGTIVARVVVARRGQILVRIAICAVTAAVFQIATGFAGAALWAAAYIGVQTLEFFAFRNVAETSTLSRRRELAFYAMAAASNTVFASFGILEAHTAGSWGLVCAGLLWSASIFNGAIVSGESRIALAASITPPLLLFITVPYFVLEGGGSLGIALAIVAAGLLNGVSAVAIWATGRRLLESATRADERARHAMLDPETGLPARQTLQAQVTAMQESAPGGIVVVAAIGIDRYSHLRGAIGHTLMLDLVGELAARISKANDDAPIARLSSATLGLAFVAPDMDSARRTAARLQSASTAPLQLGDNRVDVSTTVGLCESADAIAQVNGMSIIDRAMVAIDQARAARLPLCLFDPVQYGSPGANLSLMSEMLRALENGQMTVHYQPKYNLRSGEIVGVEALIRWTHPQRGAIRPDLFVQMAEETGHIAAMTEWVLRRAIEAQRSLVAAGHNLSISINWSGIVITDNAFTDRALAIAATAAGPICLEITETAIIRNPDLARHTLERFRAAGLTISIDDYGSGLSSLAYLKNIPADELKIDKAFVMNMAADPADTVLVQSAISLARSFGLRSVAEGVENQGTLELLYAMGCDLAQGYLIARPMPLASLLEFLDARARRTG